MIIIFNKHFTLGRVLKDILSVMFNGLVGVTPPPYWSLNLSLLVLGFGVHLTIARGYQRVGIWFPGGGIGVTRRTPPVCEDNIIIQGG